ncbi:flagellar motor switch protein FliM [Pseudemcibacter aquimaris]|uniref:flagellar motor switch protein FliM n=1 Tax=Pseudemcibacter aquimaris TaxID=2857064 RepID=UPI0020136410|nr:flagellar motor switch protein FliM [Pseudemcibacter aquimaris]MCC3860815.1 flagellar motor switch protein FliM [Pseudemcibacter aquimaris]WDU59635.1 flagellar motor switch protein FliM [Pseudemcibacter aquimaris]
MSDEDEEIDDDAVAAEWAAMAEADEEGDGEGDDDMASAMGIDRVLDQTEIDSLLGFDGDDDGEGTKTGVQALINSGLVAYERLPMLDIIFDRYVRMMSTSLRNFTSDNFEVSIDSMTSIRFGDYLNSIPLPAMLAVFEAREWENHGLITIDSNMIYSVVDALLGGRRGNAPMRIEGRPYTTIEHTLVGEMLNVMLKDLCGAFEPLSPVTFELDRMETNPRFATIAQSSNAALLIKMRADMADRGGKMELALPYATIEPIRELLLQRYMGEKFGRDSIWETHLANEIMMTDVDLDAVLDEQKMTLGEVMGFEVGQTLMLNVGQDADVDIRCSGVPMLKGKTGMMGRHKAVRVERIVGMNERQS